MNDSRDWQITLPFSVPRGDTEGAFTEALFEAAVDQAPADATGFVARADTAKAKVWITFTLIESSRELAGEVAGKMLDRVSRAVLSGDDATISAA